jgi:DNA-binding MarR family transcriptional regulator/GNAT superfamily N-acetyltransferase
MATVIAPVSDHEVAAVREFNRFYTHLIGVLGEGIAHSRFSLTEARLLFELARAPRPDVEVVALRERLGLDAGYLSRIVNRFERDGLVSRRRSSDDGRRSLLTLTDAGRAAFDLVDRQAADEVRELLAPLGDGARADLVTALRTVEAVFGTGPGDAGARGRGYLVRDIAPGDLGWAVERHGTLYHREYGWDAQFEGFVAGIVGNFLVGHDPARERAWVAEVDGRRAGCVACTRDDDETARLRILLVEPDARGLGIGTRLVDECMRFARGAGYRRMTLWTYDVLADARRIYQRAGFTLDGQRPEHAFGHDLVQQDWSRSL